MSRNFSILVNILTAFHKTGIIWSLVKLVNIIVNTLDLKNILGRNCFLQCFNHYCGHLYSVFFFMFSLYFYIILAFCEIQIIMFIGKKFYIDLKSSPQSVLLSSPLPPPCPPFLPLTFLSLPPFSLPPSSMLLHNACITSMHYLWPKLFGSTCGILIFDVSYELWLHLDKIYLLENLLV